MLIQFDARSSVLDRVRFMIFCNAHDKVMIKFICSCFCTYFPQSIVVFCMNTPVMFISKNTCQQCQHEKISVQLFYFLSQPSYFFKKEEKDVYIFYIIYVPVTNP